jgi:hypothetical protein
LATGYIPAAPRKTPWAEKKERTERIEKMQEAVDQLQSDAGWRAWIASHRTLDRFSFYNRLLVMLQVPEKRAKHANEDHMTRTQFQVAVQDAPYEVRTYNAWKAQGRQVKKGERSLMVLKPIFKKVPVLDEHGEEVPGEFETKLVGFTGLKEFDITQTEGDLPERIRMKDIEGSELQGQLDRLVNHMVTVEGYTIDLDANIKAYGTANASQKVIKIRKGQSINQKFLVLVHEIAHTRESELGAKIDYTNYSRSDAEVIVETVTMMVGEFVGIDSSASSLPYLATWKRPEDKDVFKRFAQTIDKIAREIEDLLRKDENEEDDK